MTWPSARAGRNQAVAGATTEGQRAQWRGGRARMGAAHGEGGCSGHALVEVTQWHHSGRTTPWRRGWALACCKPPPSLVCSSRRQGDWFAHGAIRFLRGSGSTVRGSKSTLIRLAVCRSPSPPSPMRKWMTADVPGSAEGASHEGTWQTQIDLHDRPCRVHPRCGHLACPALRAYSDATHHTLPPRIPVYRPPFPRTPVSDCTVPCRYVVHPGYAYPSALFWVGLLFNKAGPCQKKYAAFSISLWDELRIWDPGD